MALQSDHEFAPTEIARAAFPTAFRGYDQDAVRRYLSRLAAALEHQQTFEDLGDLQVSEPASDRVEELEAEIVALQDEVRELETELVQRSVDEADEGSRRTGDLPEFDESRVIELLGQETARVLESARSASADILKRAENQASSLKGEAKKELTEARRQAKKLVAERRAEAEAAIDELTAEAERSANQVTADADEHRKAVVAESSKILADAEARAEVEQQEAESRARQTVADAEALRRRVVAELVADRRVAQADLDRMVDARDRLALSLAVVRGELDGLADQLVEVGSGSGGAGDGAAEEADDAEVARLIERLEAERDGNEADGSAPERSRSDASTSKPAATATTSTSGGRAGRRSTVDEPTQEMPAISVSDPDVDHGAPDDLGDTTADAAGAEAQSSAGVAGESLNGVADDGEPTVPPISNGVFDGDDEELLDLRDGDDETVADDADLDLDLDADLDPDLDAAGSSEDLNAPPADGVPLSLVEGFSTIVLNDEDAGGSKGSKTSKGSTGARSQPDPAPVGTLVDTADPDADPATIITTVAARTSGRSATGNRGDLVLDEPFTERLPEWFGARDVAVTRSEANLRRQLRRALNDDQSEVLDRLRSGRGSIEVDELPEAEEQRDHFLAPLRRGLTDIARSGARAGGADDVDAATLDHLIEQLARYLVDRVRTPTVQAIQDADHVDREKILEPIRAVYRDFRNIGLPDLVADALNEAFAIGLYDSIGEGSPVLWAIDPRTDPDPVCEVNRDRADLVKGEAFPSGHVRPLAVPGCRCLVIGLH